MTNLSLIVANELEQTFLQVSIFAMGLEMKISLVLIFAESIQIHEIRENYYHTDLFLIKLTRNSWKLIKTFQKGQISGKWLQTKKKNEQLKSLKKKY